MTELPKGRLLENRDGTISVQLRASRAGRQDIRSWYDRISGLLPPRVLPHGGPVDGPRGLEVRFEETARDSEPLSAVI